MTATNRTIGMSGALAARVVRARRAPWAWRIRNTVRIAYLLGWLANVLAWVFSRVTGIPTITARLEARLIRATGEVINYGVLSWRVVTDAGVAFLVDDWDSDAQDITTMNFHACGTDNTAENANQTALIAEATTITDRVAGTKSQPAAYQLRSVGTQSFTNTGSIVEHGLFSVITESSGTLWDRSIFTSIGVGNGDSIQWTYTCSINSGS